MNNAQLTAMRMFAESLQTGTGDYTILSNGIVVMFGLSRSRAIEFSEYYPSAQVVRGIPKPTERNGLK